MTTNRLALGLVPSASAIRRESVPSLLIGAVGYIALGGDRPVISGALKQALAVNPTNAFGRRRAAIKTFAGSFDHLVGAHHDSVIVRPIAFADGSSLPRSDQHVE